MKILPSTMIVIFFVSTVRAQTSSDSPNDGQNYQYPYAKFSPSLAVIIVVLIAALFFVGFFSIYIRHCSGSSATSGGIRRSISSRGRRAAAARGLDASVIEGFPTFSYAEVKGHKIGKGVLECAVCLNEFQDQETLRLLPKCDHVFHPQCIGAWLESHVTCPVCRANLVPGDGEEPNQQSTPGSRSVRDGQNVVVVQINDDDSNQTHSQGMDYKRMFSFSKFRSHSTGHDSLVRPGDNLDRFTMRLPAGVRKEVMNRAALPRMGSSRRGYRRSERWVFFTRAFSMRSPRVVAETGEGGGVGRTLVNMSSFKCLQSSVDEERLFSNKPERSA